MQLRILNPCQFLKGCVPFKVMPAKNSIKTYVENGYYHVYNRGVNGQEIFKEDDDYRYFLYLLKLYLSKPDKKRDRTKESTNKYYSYSVKNYYQQAVVICYCLMPNHFHLIIKQSGKRTIESLMRALTIKYSMFFNKKYNRKGYVFQGRYKAILIEQESYLLHLTRYIHLNSQDLSPQNSKITQIWTSYKDYPFSSYSWYLQEFKNDWFDPTDVLCYFKHKPAWIPKDILSYQSFTETDEKDYSESLNKIFSDF